MTWTLLLMLAIAIGVAFWLPRGHVANEARKFKARLRRASDRELRTMMAEALRRQSMFREQEKVLALRSEDDLLVWVRSAVARVGARVDAIRRERSMRDCRSETQARAQ
jgi:hypothetical protein